MITFINSYNGIEGDTAVAIGKFDGLHIGHEQILKTLEECKKEGLKTVILSLIRVRMWSSGERKIRNC